MSTGWAWVRGGVWNADSGGWSVRVQEGKSRAHMGANNHTFLIWPTLRFDRIGRFNVWLEATTLLRPHLPRPGLACPPPSLCLATVAELPSRAMLPDTECLLSIAQGGFRVDAMCIPSLSGSGHHLDRMEERKSSRCLRQSPCRPTPGPPALCAFPDKYCMNGAAARRRPALQSELYAGTSE